MNELQKAKLQNAIDYASQMTMGIYVQTVVAADGTRTERTEWQNGWNAALMSLAKTQRRIRDLFKILPEDVALLMLELLDSYMLEINVHEDKPIIFYLNMNDTFGYSCADAEEVIVSEIPEVHRLWKKYGHHGLTAWSAIKRNVDPIDECKTKQYALAVKEICKHND